MQGATLKIRDLKFFKLPRSYYHIWHLYKNDGFGYQWEGVIQADIYVCVCVCVYHITYTQLLQLITLSYIYIYIKMNTQKALKNLPVWLLNISTYNNFCPARFFALRSAALASIALPSAIPADPFLFPVTTNALIRRLRPMFPSMLNTLFSWKSRFSLAVFLGKQL